MTEPEYPPLTDEDVKSLERMQQAVAEAKAAGRWQTQPPDPDDDKFFGPPLGADPDGEIVTHGSAEEARRAAVELRRRQGGSAPGAPADRPDPES